MSQREAQKATTRERITCSAVGLLKKQGMAETSVSEVMARAGLTVGGFYAHFQSKEVLAEEAVRRALQERRELFLALPHRDGWLSRLRSALEAYFSRQHRDDIAGGCPMSMAAIDAARSGTAVAVFLEELANMAEAFETGRDPSALRAPREAVLGSLMLMVGGMILARAAKGTELSDQLLKAARTFGAAALSDLARDYELPAKKAVKTK